MHEADRKLWEVEYQCYRSELKTTVSGEWEQTNREYEEKLAKVKRQVDLGTDGNVRQAEHVWSFTDVRETQDGEHGSSGCFRTGAGCLPQLQEQPRRDG